MSFLVFPRCCTRTRINWSSGERKAVDALRKGTWLAARPICSWKTFAMILYVVSTTRVLLVPFENPQQQHPKAGSSRDPFFFRGSYIYPRTVVPFSFPFFCDEREREQKSAGRPSPTTTNRSVDQRRRSLLPLAHAGPSFRRFVPCVDNKTRLAWFWSGETKVEEWLSLVQDPVCRVVFDTD